MLPRILCRCSLAGPRALEPVPSATNTTIVPRSAALQEGTGRRRPAGRRGGMILRGHMYSSGDKGPGFRRAAGARSVAIPYQRQQRFRARRWPRISPGSISRRLIARRGARPRRCRRRGHRLGGEAGRPRSDALRGQFGGTGKERLLLDRDAWNGKPTSIFRSPHTGTSRRKSMTASGATPRLRTEIQRR